MKCKFGCGLMIIGPYSSEIFENEFLNNEAKYDGGALVFNPENFGTSCTLQKNVFLSN